MNIQKINSANFGKLYYQNTNKNHSVTQHQKNVWSIVKDRLDCYVSDIVPHLEEKADVDVVLLYNTDGSSTLKLKDRYNKFQDGKNYDNPDIIENIRSPKIAIKFTNRDQKSWDSVTKKLNIFINDCENYLKTCGPEYNQVKANK